MHRSGIGADEFDEILRAQGGVCAICGRPDPEHVDHDHTSGRVSGILCSDCNGGLGQFRDSIDALEQAVTRAARSDPDVIALTDPTSARARRLRTLPV